MRWYRVKQSLAYRKIGSNVYIVDSKNSMLYKLNETAAIIWEGIVKKKSVKQIVKDISSTYDVDLQTVENDVNEIINQLVTNGLIEK